MKENEWQHSNCPYCRQILLRRPKRKSKCPHCSESIRVKRPFGSPVGTKALMTNKQAEEEDFKWRNAQAQQQWARDLSAVGVAENEFEREHQRLGAKDNGLSAAHHILSRIMGTEKDLHCLKMATALMGRVAEKQGRDPMPFKETVYRLELEGMRIGARAVTVMTSAPHPEYGPDKRTGHQCEQWAGREFTIEEALAEMPLPCGPKCACYYRPTFNWE